MHTQDFSPIIQAITKQGYAISDHFLPTSTIEALKKHAEKLLQGGQMKLAGTGLQANHNAIRGDHIMWLRDDDPSLCVQTYLQKMRALQQALNQQLFFNLHELEAHLAIYPIGTRYAKHLDQFSQGRNALRQISCVLYLNTDWQEAFGGQLRMYLPEGNQLDIFPMGGRLVAFMSSEFIHEVLPASHPRVSLTGWFRQRDSRLI